MRPYQREIVFVDEHVKEVDNMSVFQLPQDFHLSQCRHVYSLHRKTSVSGPCNHMHEGKVQGCFSSSEVLTSLAIPRLIFLMATTPPLCKQAILDVLGCPFVQ